MQEVPLPAEDPGMKLLCSAFGQCVPQIELRSLGELRKSPHYARIVSKRRVRLMTDSILANGFIGAIIVDEKDFVICGWMRCIAAEKIGMKQVPTLKVTGLNDTQKRVFALADNKIGENAGWDRDVLKRELGELAEALPPLNWDLTLTGFEPAEVDALFLDEGDGKPDPVDDLPSLRPDVTSRLGDLWELGSHRLLCGDSRSKEDVDRLMEGGRARMAFLDPPYNVRVADIQGRGRIKHQEFACASGEMSAAQYVEFLKTTLGQAARVSVDGAVHFVCNDWRHITEMIDAGRVIYGTMLNLVVWAKTTPGQGSFYRSQHELLGVFRVGADGHHQNNVQLGRFGRNRGNVWTYPGINGFGLGRASLLRMHPTVKPVALIADAMRDCTTKGDMVVDLFAGSGSTILAAEKVGRRARALDIEPRYVDAAIRRWEAYTKAEAVLVADGRTFAEIEAQRRPEATATRADRSRSAALPGDLGPSANMQDSSNGDWVALSEGRFDRAEPDR